MNKNAYNTEIANLCELCDENIKRFVQNEPRPATEISVGRESTSDTTTTTTSATGGTCVTYGTFSELFMSVKLMAQKLEPLADQIAQFAVNYDFDSQVAANGYRTFIDNLCCAIKHFSQVSQKTLDAHKGFMFRHQFYYQELVSCYELLQNFEILAKLFIEVNEKSTNNELWVTEREYIFSKLNLFEELKLEAFYGRCLGFQYETSLRGILKIIMTFMCAFSEAYYNDGSFLWKTVSSAWKSGKYLFDPQKRSERIVSLFQNADIHFCKAFWSLTESEFINFWPSVLTPATVDQLIAIPPENLTFTNTDNEDVDIPIPSSFIGSKAINVRLVSSSWRKGMIGLGSRRASVTSEPSSRLLIHCHGGGFIAQSSQSHLFYLKDWAKIVNVPILSIDYSLAPEAPFPRALDEVFYAYSWALKNTHLLGTTGDDVVIVGDSAGANLCLGLCMKCNEFRIRKPKAMLLVYVPTLIDIAMTPSYVMSLMDSILPLRFLLNCVEAYAKGDGVSAVTVPTQPDELADKQTCNSPIADAASAAEEKQPRPDDDEDPSQFLSLSNDSLSASNSCNTLTNPEISQFDTNLHESMQNIPEIIDQEFDQDENSISQNPNNSKIMSVIMNAVFNWLSYNKDNIPTNNCLVQRKWEDFETFRSVDSYFLSPYLAPDDILKSLPTAFILSTKLDPCLDDCIMFAKKLRKIGNRVSFQVFDRLPHGFLNLTAVSKEAYEASNKCAQILNTLFDE